ncbi:hypothetical protein ACFQRL_01470 [Microbacterium fluvii]|uniref:Uncharacterized protein n=1 Tax=Microbacterium fluvii TaxID=415215 RepID=A0ABW2HB19_9MICO|nr:hypothetical protein [Microbacterium fluvii]MCU4671257.1 hypothetical protein [Microbacterium fluvii]
MTDDAATTRPPFRTTTPGPISPSPTSTPSAAPTEVSPARWAAIEADLAERGATGTPALVSAEAVTWPNGALGCAKPGQTYTQAEVAGLQVIVEVDGTTYDYRFGRTDTPKLCM